MFLLFRLQYYYFMFLFCSLLLSTFSSHFSYFLCYEQDKKGFFRFLTFFTNDANAHVVQIIKSNFLTTSSSVLCRSPVTYVDSFFLCEEWDNVRNSPSASWVHHYYFSISYTWDYRCLLIFFSAVVFFIIFYYEKRTTDRKKWQLPPKKTNGSGSLWNTLRDSTSFKRKGQKWIRIENDEKEMKKKRCEYKVRYHCIDVLSRSTWKLALFVIKKQYIWVS